jgi:ATP-dependent 26S proteasome regulatory subunit
MSNATQPQEGRQRFSELCLDPGKPPEARARLLHDALESSADDTDAQVAVLADLLRLAVRNPEEDVLRLMEAYQQGMAELQQGAVRPATYLGPAEGRLPPGPGPRVHVVSPDGQERFPILQPGLDENALSPGMTVYLDARGSVVLGSTGQVPRSGQEGTFLRIVEGNRLIEAGVQNDRLILHTAAPVRAALTQGELRAGDRLLVCPRRQVAFAVVPAPADYRHRFIDRSAVAEVLPDRDIGQPHEVLDYLVRRVRAFLFRADLLASFDVRPRCAVLLTGPSGCGKTLTIRAFLYQFDRMLRERTGRNDLGSRIVRVKVAELLSEWLGRSDKNIEELFDDLYAVAREEVETTSGERLRLPVVVLLEEVEGLARQRGRHDAVYDRILTTLLQRLDDPTEDLARLPLVLISTTNRPDLIDAAMTRRLGRTAKFTRLDREGLAAVLRTRLRQRYPYAAGTTRGKIIERVAQFLFGPGADPHGVTAVTLEGGQELIKRRRDFLTGALVDQAVTTAIDHTVLEAAEGVEGAGLSAEALIDALKQTTDALADQLTTDNAADHLDLPEHQRVIGVRRLRGRPPLLPASLDELDN